MAWVLLSPRSIVAATFDFVHVEANAGGSSGGHVAVCFTESCYHFQQSTAAKLLLVREPRDRFEHGYRAVGNRSLVIRRVAVSDEAFTRILDTFAAYYRVQTRQIAVRDAYVADHQLLALLTQQQPVSAPPALPASGYFFTDAVGDASPAPGSSITTALADRIRATYGAGVLERRSRDLLEQIHALRPSTTDVVLPAAAVSPVSSPTFFAERYRELLSGYLAIEVLSAGRGLIPGSFIVPPEPDGALSGDERAVLRHRAAELESELIQLFASRRPDWGYPLLVGIARLLSLHASLSSGSLVLLDTFPAKVQTLPPTAWGGFEDALAQLLEERREDFRRARTLFFEGDSASEARWSRVEVAGNLLADLTKAERNHVALRVPDDALIPERGVWRSDWPLPELEPDSLPGALSAAQAHVRAYQAAFDELYNYDLVTRNCATELLRELESGRTQDDDVKPPRLDGLLSFIPFVAADEIGDRYRVIATTAAPSYRQLALAHASEHDNGIAVHLREMNVLSARIYRWHSADPTFLVFSDDVWPIRPLAGAINMASSVVATVAGVAWAPIDAGTFLADALNGIVYSLPELAFVSIRKGSFPFAPRAWLQQDSVVPAQETVD